MVGDGGSGWVGLHRESALPGELITISRKLLTTGGWMGSPSRVSKVPDAKASEYRK